MAVGSTLHFLNQVNPWCPEGTYKSETCTCRIALYKTSYFSEVISLICKVSYYGRQVSCSDRQVSCGGYQVSNGACNVCTGGC